MANSSAIMRCGMDIPSPMNRNTYFGDPAAAIAAMHITHTANARHIWIFDFILMTPLA